VPRLTPVGPPSSLGKLTFSLLRGITPAKRASFSDIQVSTARESRISGQPRVFVSVPLPIFPGYSTDMARRPVRISRRRVRSPQEGCRRPSISRCFCRLGGRQVRRVMPMRRGNAPLTAVSTMSGAKNANDNIMWTDRLLRFSRRAISSVSFTVPLVISCNHSRPRAIARTRDDRTSDRIGRS
jgi:hypothetical protein